VVVAELIEPCLDSGRMSALQAAFAANEQGTPGEPPTHRQARAHTHAAVLHTSGWWWCVAQANATLVAMHAEYLATACRTLARAGQRPRLAALLAAVGDRARAALALCHLYLEQYVVPA
jgi:hypothetical protein